MILRFPMQHRLPSVMEDFNLTLASELLRRDPLFYKIPLGKVPELVRGALAAGEDTAKKLTNIYGTAEPLRLARLMGMRVLFDITHYPSKPLTLLSRYRENPPTIVIYEAALRKCRENVAKWDIKSKYLLSELTNICVCHELYHHYERESCNFVDLTCKVPVLNLGFLRIEKSVRTISEIAAHSFARKLLNLSFLPCLLDPRLFDFAADKTTHEKKSK